MAWIWRCSSQIVWKTFFDQITLTMPKAGSGFYAVRIGRTPGVYMTWDECLQEVKGFPKARYKKFHTQEEAEQFVSGVEVGGSTAQPPSGTSRHTNSATPHVPPGTCGNTPGESTSEVRRLQTLSKNLCHTTDLLGDQLQMSQSVLQELRGKTTPASDFTSFNNTLTVALGQVKSLKALAKQCREFSTGLGQSGLSCAKRSASGDEELPRESKRSKSQGSSSTGGQRSNGIQKKVAEVYTDGCCHANGKSTPKAGLGVYWGPQHPNNVAMRLLGRQTNNRAEIHAARKAINQAQMEGYDEIIVNTDSQFLINCITKWIHKWKQNGWTLSNGNSVVNRKDLEQLEEAMEGITVVWNHVKGHAGIHGNEEADRLANQGARLPYIKHSAESEDEEYE